MPNFNYLPRFLLDRERSVLEFHSCTHMHAIFVKINIKMVTSPDHKTVLNIHLTILLLFPKKFVIKIK